MIVESQPTTWKDVVLLGIMCLFFLFMLRPWRKDDKD